MRGAWALVLIALLAACSAGEPAADFLNPGVAHAFLPLTGMRGIIEGRGAAVAIANGIAVTNAHNIDLVDPAAVIGASRQYDLLYFRTQFGIPMTTAMPWTSEEVIAYGSGVDGSLRMARGRVTVLTAPVQPLCPTCGQQQAFTFEADAGPGFSGGPVVDATDGRLVGITFGFVDEKGGGRLMYAYDMDRVAKELAAAKR